MRIWITFMNITVRALVTTPTLTVQHMKNTDSALREQDIKRDSYMKEMKNCYEKQFNAAQVKEFQTRKLGSLLLYNAK